MMSVELFKFDYILLISIILASAGLVFLWHLQERRSVFVWRLFNVVILLFLICQPTLVDYSRDRRPSIAVAVDVSPSMLLAGRAKIADEILTKYGPELETKFQVKKYVFASLANELHGSLSAFLKDKRLSESFGFYTDLYKSLWEIRRENSGKLSGILLLSDGNHNAGSLPKNWVEELNVPVFPVAVGSNKAIKDFSINSIKVSDFVFKNIPLKVSVNISAVGFKGKTITVNLKRQDLNEVLSSVSRKITSDTETQDIALNYTPNTNGRFMFEAEIIPGEGEKILANNKKKFYINVVRDKIRVLYICGQPGPEYSFLRHHLKNDPMVELVSFVILRNPENIALVQDYDLSLIPFPVETLFTKDLYNFDVMIFDNFTYDRFGFQPYYLENIKKWVTEKGGGFIMIAGANSFGKGKWAGTPVEKILPVIFEKPQDEYETGLFIPKVENDKHEIMDITSDSSNELVSWKNLQKLDGCQALTARQNATVLLRHPWKNWVVLASWDIGKGRVAALGTNTTWRWALGSQTPELYNTFWKNIIRYLSHSEKSFEWKLSFDSPEYFSGQDYNLKLRGNKEINVKDVQVTVIDPSGRKFVQTINKTSEKQCEGGGIFSTSGRYVFQLFLNEGGLRSLKDTAAIDVKPYLLQEKTNINLNDELLSKIAEESGGIYFKDEEISVNKMYNNLKDTKNKTAVKKQPLWQSPWLLFFVMISFLGEWIYRRRIGLW